MKIKIVINYIHKEMFYMLFENMIKNIYKKQMFSRQDETHTAYYFTSDDFEGLNKTPYTFKSSKGHLLKGYFYSYKNPIENRIVVFDHGFGEGHRAYMKEIEMLCAKGYLVFSYDHTGCMESGGENCGGLSQSLVDLNDCLNSLKEHYPNYSFSVMGHSWGGYSSLNICKLHQDLTHIVVLAGPNSVKRMIESSFKGILKGYRQCIYELEKQSNPNFIDFDAVDSLKDTTAKILVIYSDNDPVVSKEMHYDTLAQLPHITCVLSKNKGHNPNYTREAVKLLNDYQTKLKKAKLDTLEKKKAFIASFDWNAMTEQDNYIWEIIYNHLGR